eukprot:g29882.t1
MGHSGRSEGCHTTPRRSLWGEDRNARLGDHHANTGRLLWEITMPTPGDRAGRLSCQHQEATLGDRHANTGRPLWEIAMPTPGHCGGRSPCQHGEVTVGNRYVNTRTPWWEIAMPTLGGHHTRRLLRVSGKTFEE